MTVLLFFDDKHLVARDNLKRVTAKPAMIADATYIDPAANTSGGFPSVCRDPHSGQYHMFYQGWLPDGKVVMLAAISDDGLHFTPRNTAEQSGIAAPRCPNQLLPEMDGELAKVFEDTRAPGDERLKALVVLHDRERFRIENVLYTSGDGLHWTLSDGIRWNTRGAEPGAGCFYCETTESYILTQRPDWGVRRVCIAETRDWRHFTDPELILQADSLDAPLAEAYGMPAFAYDGWYIGFLWIYQPPAVRGTHKYWNGKMTCQLAYSMNGRHFQRALREPFIGNGDPADLTWGMVFPSALYTAADGSLIVAASASRYEHGHFDRPGGGSIVFYRLRRDGFVALETNGGPGALCTRGLLADGGEIAVNLDCPGDAATCAVYADGGITSLEGYEHSNCIPFTGDSEDWTPRWQNGRTFAALAGRVVYIEIAIGSGRVYSIRGKFTPMMFMDGERYKRFATIPDVRGLA